MNEIELEQKLATYDGEDRIVPGNELLATLKDKARPKLHFGSKIPKLDKIIKGGFKGGQLIVVSGITGQGKCHGKDTEILMHDGSIKKVQDIKIGDKLMGDDSQCRTVTSLVNGYGQLYQIYNRKGVNYTVNEDHILCLKRTRDNKFREDRTTPRKDRKGEIREISIKDYLTASNKFKHVYKGYKTEILFSEKTLSVEPYFLGLWLGDGHSAGVRITNADIEVEHYLSQYASQLSLSLKIISQPENKAKSYAITNVKRQGRYIFSLQGELRKLNVLNDKHIPLAYRTGSTQQRCELLAGIIDSDGYVNKPNGYEVALKSKKLALDIIYVANSLGLMAYFTKERIIKDKCYYRLSITGNVSIIPVKIARKKLPPRQQIKDVLMYGISVVPLKYDYYYGFTIDGNGRYLLSDFSVTHNSTLCKSIGLSAMEQGLLSTWFSYELDMEEFLSDFPHDTVANILLPATLKGRSPEWIEYRAWEAKLKYGSNLVFIDHLHFLVDLHHSRNISFDVGSVVRNLKLLAVKHNLVVFLICHTMKTKGDTEVELGLGDVRDSSLIEQEADIVLYVWRDLEVDNRSIMKIAKNRPTGTINKKIRLTYQGGRLYEEADTGEDTGTNQGDRPYMGKGSKKGISKGGVYV